MKTNLILTLFAFLLASGASAQPQKKSAQLVSGEVTFEFDATSVRKKDANDAPVVAWQGLHFDDVSGKALVSNPAFNAPSWQIRVRQYLISTNGGKALAKPYSLSAKERKESSLEKLDVIRKKYFSAVADVAGDEQSLQADNSDTDPDRFGPAPKDTYNMELFKWSEYNMALNHLIWPAEAVFIVKTNDNHYAKLQMTSYSSKGAQICLSKVAKGPAEKVVGAYPDCGESPVENAKTYVRLRWKYNKVAGDTRLE